MRLATGFMDAKRCKSGGLLTWMNQPCCVTDQPRQWAFINLLDHGGA